MSIALYYVLYTLHMLAHLIFTTTHFMDKEIKMEEFKCAAKIGFEFRLLP